jgi:Cdc6-like AAA superfamily ATPase
MPQFDPVIHSYEESKELSVVAATVFQPRTPITTQELFAGRWNQITTLADAVGQSGLHVVIYGERGVGKTSLANIVRPVLNVFDRQKGDPERLVVKTNANTGDDIISIWKKILQQIAWESNRPSLGFVPGRKRMTVLEAFDLQSEFTIDDIPRVLSQMPGAVFIIDEFDRAAANTSRDFTDLIKALSDFAINCTVILVGVSDTIDALIEDHASISRAITQILLPRMKPQELREILAKAEQSLGVLFSSDAHNLIVNLSQGLPHYTHLLGLHTVRRAFSRYSRTIERDDVFSALKEAVEQAEQSVTVIHSKAVHSAHKDALYRKVLLACGVAATQTQDSLGYFNPSAVVEPLTVILGRDVPFGTFNSHLSDFCQPKRCSVLERDGGPRAYRFRFRDPLLVPFVLMDAIANELVTAEQGAIMLGSSF